MKRWRQARDRLTSFEIAPQKQLRRNLHLRCHEREQGAVTAAKSVATQCK
jgi:hypothetical protein